VRSELSAHTQTESCWSERNPFELVLLLQVQFGWKNQSGKSNTHILVAVVAMDSDSVSQRESERERERAAGVREILLIGF
jgi:hypothetical protein